MSDRGLDVLTSLSLGQYLKAEVWDFPVMSERTRLTSYLAEVNKLSIILALFLRRIQEEHRK